MPDITMSTTYNNPRLKSAPVVIFRDDFNRADGLLNGSLTPVGGLEWLFRSSGTGTGRLLIRNGRAGAHNDAGGELRSQYGVVDTGTPDGTFRITYAEGTGVNSAIRVAIRFQTGENMLLLTVTNGVWTFYDRTDSVNTLFGTSSIAAVPGQRVEVTTLGSLVQIRIDGQLAFDVTTTSHADSTMFGFGSPTVGGGPNVWWDDAVFTTPGS